MADLITTGLEPEFYIDDIPQFEFCGGGASLRLYVACRRHGQPIVQFTVVGSLSDFARMAKQVLDMTTNGADAEILSSLLASSKAH